jgi:hypothetical protein
MRTGGRLFVVLAGTAGGAAGGAWLSGAVLVILGPDAQILDVGAAISALVPLILAQFS